MLNVRWTAFPVLLIASLVAVGGCGGDEKKDGGGIAGTPSAKGTSSGDGDPTNAAGEGTASDDVKELQKLAEKFAQSTFHAVYTLDSDEEGISAGTITIYKAGPNKLRFGIKAEQDGEVVEYALIQSDAGSYFCIAGGDLGDLAGVPGTGGVCTESDPEDPSNPVAGLADEFGDLDVGDVQIVSKEARTIAGQNGTCYVVNDNDSGETSTSCFTDDGVLLAIESAAQDGANFAATSVESGVTDADFEPPYPVQDLPGLNE